MVVCFISKQSKVTIDQTVKLGGADQIGIKIWLLHCIFLKQNFDFSVMFNYNLRKFLTRPPC